jgi:hypothetical protein
MLVVRGKACSPTQLVEYARGQRGRRRAFGSSPGV